MLVVFTGGARSGKSSAATAAAARTGAPVTFIATAEPGDDEMARRIARHRAERPPAWTTVEAPHDLCGAVADADPDATIVIDCLAIWATNRLLDGSPPDETALVDDAARLAHMLRDRAPTALVVTNEVGSGVVPATPLGREFRDLLGLVNQAVVGAADSAYLVVAGRLLPLHKPAGELGG